jgi:hypothetical protein
VVLPASKNEGAYRSVRLQDKIEIFRTENRKAAERLPQSEKTHYYLTSTVAHDVETFKRDFARLGRASFGKR